MPLPCRGSIQHFLGRLCFNHVQASHADTHTHTHESLWYCDLMILWDFETVMLGFHEPMILWYSDTVVLFFCWVFSYMRPPDDHRTKGRQEQMSLRPNEYFPGNEMFFSKRSSLQNMLLIPHDSLHTFHFRPSLCIFHIICINFHFFLFVYIFIYLHTSIH